jgi:secreted PhoX family phosphatase
MIADMSRRGLLRGSAVGAASLLGLRVALNNRAYAQQAGFGPLLPDPEGILDLPAGFKYQAFSTTGEMMNDGRRVPGLHDGMAAYAGPNGTTVLVRNHEMSVAEHGTDGSPFTNVASFQNARNLVYDTGSTAPAVGGTTNLVYNTRLKRLEQHFLSLTGTIRNCAGGLTPWNTWLTCEETNVTIGSVNGGSVLNREHGWVFEVSATAQQGLQQPVPLRAMGRFSHEAAAVDPGTSIVYQTEDRGDACFYRFLPNQPADLQAGGRLQALKIRGVFALDTRNQSSVNIQRGTPLQVEWVALTDVHSPNDDLRHQAQGKGAAIFGRLEGCWWGNGRIYFVTTDGGPAGLGQIFQYTPNSQSGGTLELFLEPASESQFSAPDNICLAPSGDIIVCEDGSGTEYVHGVTPAGSVYKIARNSLNSSEFAGACFSPDGTTLFVNIQSPGITLAITGPWHRKHS